MCMVVYGRDSKINQKLLPGVPVGGSTTAQLQDAYSSQLSSSGSILPRFGNVILLLHSFIENWEATS